MNTPQKLQQLIDHNFERIGEIEIQSDVLNFKLIISHWQDAEQIRKSDLSGLTLHQDPEAALEISTYSENGEYRFTKGQVNLKRGWVMGLQNVEELRQALDLFYPACLGLYLALEDGSLEVENLRDKLNRQTGMYRFARSISDAGAQELVRKVCGPAHQCAKRILWQIDENTPLENSEASRFNGIPTDIPENMSIPLLCREACNHFVAECRKTAKAEFEAKSS